MQLSHNQKIFFERFAEFLKSRLNFEHFEKIKTLTAFLFPKLWILKMWLDISLESPVSEDPSTSNMLNVPRNC